MADHSKSGAGTENDGQLPPGVVAQAEAVASNNAHEPASSDVPREVGTSSKQSPSASQGRNLAGYMADAPVEDAPPPAYSESYGVVDMSQLGLNTRANVASKRCESH